MTRVKKAVFPAAGLGTRFLPATKAQPKEMLPLVDTPTIQYVVEEAVASGLAEIILVTGRNKRAIEDHFDAAFELEYYLQDRGKMEELAQIKTISELASVCYVRQKEPLGLGHAILCARPLVVGDLYRCEAVCVRREFVPLDPLTRMPVTTPPACAQSMVPVGSSPRMPSPNRNWWNWRTSDRRRAAEAAAKPRSSRSAR